MFLLRPARADDLAAVLELARLLDSPNLPADERFLEQRLDRSERSFASGGPPSGDREYQFALEDEGGRVVGTCAILSKHGTPEMPHTYMRVAREERVSESAGVRTSHITFQLGVCTDGPTELGSLVLEPEARRRPGWPGKLLSWGRFAYIASHRSSFEDALLAEMRATFDEEGRSAFWDAFGSCFTGMSYAEADRRSARDKAFIIDLFPDTPFYATLLGSEVAAQLGLVHEESQPAVHLLERAGFRWIGQIDPFDAGPFYGAATDDVVPIDRTLHAAVSPETLQDGDRPWIASTGKGSTFRATATAARADGSGALLPAAARERLGVGTGDPVSLTPLPASRKGDPRG